MGRRIAVFYICISVLLAILPLEAFTNSVKSVLSYIFIPQIRASHNVQEYFKNAWDTTQHLLNTESENEALREEVRQARLNNAQLHDLLEENKRLSEMLSINPQQKWPGVMARVAYRDPVYWNTLTIDKGLQNGVVLRSAVLASAGGVIGLAGEITEEGDSTSKVLLLNDTDFSAVAQLPDGTEGLMTGAGADKYLKLRFLPLDVVFEEGMEVYTSARSEIFPRGILIGAVKGEDLSSPEVKTSVTLNIIPAVRANAVQEVFVVERGQK